MFRALAGLTREGHTYITEHNHNIINKSLQKDNFSRRNKIKAKASFVHATQIQYTNCKKKGNRNKEIAQVMTDILKAKKNTKNRE